MRNMLGLTLVLLLSIHMPAYSAKDDVPDSFKADNIIFTGLTKFKTALLKEFNTLKGAAQYRSFFKQGDLRIMFWNKDYGKFAQFGSYNNPNIIWINKNAVMQTLEELRNIAAEEGAYTEKEIFKLAARLWVPNLAHETQHKIHYDYLKNSVGAILAKTTGVDYPPRVTENEVNAYAAQCFAMFVMEDEIQTYTTRGELNNEILGSCKQGPEKFVTIISEKIGGTGSVNTPHAYEASAALAKKKYIEYINSATYGQAMYLTDNPAASREASDERDPKRTAKYKENAMLFWKTPELIEMTRDYYDKIFKQLVKTWKK
ncbi:hypothetical protein ACFL6Y_07345 [Elusimicrobiota bacterium]